MPRIEVNERDLSWYYRSRVTNPVNVLVPGIAKFGPTDRPVILDEKNFKKVLGEGSVSGEDLSYHIANSLVMSGIGVLFWRIDLGGLPAKGEFIAVDSEDQGFLKAERLYQCPTTQIVLTIPAVAGSHGAVIATIPAGSAPAEGGDPVDSVQVTFSAPSGSTLTPEDLLKITSSELITALVTADVGGTSTDLSGKLVFSSGVNISAKYSGTAGNSISVDIQGTGSNRYFVVKYGGTIVEKLVYNFTDIQSPYWYELTNESSEYIEVSVDEDFFDKSSGASFPASVKLSGGTDYDSTVESDPSDPKVFIEKVANKLINQINNTEVNLMDILGDPLNYDFNVIIDGGYNKYDSSNPSTVMSQIDDFYISLAETRGTAFYLVDGYRGFDANEFYTYTGLSSNNGKSASGFNSSYAVAVGPWSTSQLVSSGAIRTLPGSYVFLVRWGQSLDSGAPMWLAPAGVKRASVGGIVKSTDYVVGSAILDSWQNHVNTSSTGPTHNINPIMKLKQYGYVIYGNSTLLQTRFDESTSMLQSLSTRIVANMIKSRAFDISIYLQFDQIDDDLFAQFKVLMGRFMDQLKYGGALYDYKLIVDRSNMTLDDLNTRTIPVRIMISPNPAAENFIINLEISQAGVTFGDDSTENTIEG